MIRTPDDSPRSGEATSGLPPALADRIGFLLGRAHLAHLKIAGPRLAELGLSGKGMGALGIVVTEGPLSQQRLSRRQGIDRTTMVAVVDELERTGLVERRRDPADRRAYALHATGKGHRTLTRATEATERAEAQFLAPLSAGEQQELRSLLRRLLA